MQFKFLALAASLASVAFAAPAPPATIKSSLETIGTATVKLNATVAGYSGDLLGLIPITTDSIALLINIKSGTKVANNSPQLDFDTALDIAGATGTLANDVTDIIATLIRTKPKFDKLLIVTPIIKETIVTQRAATAELSKAILAKIPAELAAIAAILIQQIDDTFAQGVAAYS